MSKIRQFESGATRDTDADKLDYEGFFSPLVLERYGQYMNKHRIQADGGIRDSDNWQKHFGAKHYDVCMKSLWRHFMDLWLEHRGFPSRDGIMEALMAIIFNAMAYADKYLKDKLKDKNETKK
ncbi:hypothetical protein ACFLQL_03050 [Verrucomicrobiota bacterium]